MNLVIPGHLNTFRHNFVSISANGSTDTIFKFYHLLYYDDDVMTVIILRSSSGDIPLLIQLQLSHPETQSLAAHFIHNWWPRWATLLANHK